MLSDFGYILVFVIGAALFVGVALTVAKLIRPNRPNPEKQTTYECGEEPTGSAWGQFNIRFYIIGIIFLLFDVEIVFLFPWAVVFGDAELNAATAYQWGWLAIAEMAIFVFTLGLGLAYVWRKGYLDWVKPQPVVPQSNSKIPLSVYQQFNKQYEQNQTK